MNAKWFKNCPTTEGNFTQILWVVCWAGPEIGKCVVCCTHLSPPDDTIKSTWDQTLWKPIEAGFDHCNKLLLLLLITNSSLWFGGGGDSTWKDPEAVVLDNCAELHLSENSKLTESDLDSSLTCVWWSYNSDQMSSYRQWCIPPLSP